MRAAQPVGRAGLAFARGGLVSFALAFHMASELSPIVFAGPLDVYRGAMLPVIESGLRELLAATAPYTRFEHIPWRPAPSCGPPFWLPYVIPVVAQADLWILTLRAYPAGGDRLVFVTAVVALDPIGCSPRSQREPPHSVGTAHASAWLDERARKR